MRNMKHIKITNEESNRLVCLINEKNTLYQRHKLIEVLEQIGYPQNFKNRSTNSIIKFAKSCVKANRTNADNLVVACSYVPTTKKTKQTYTEYDWDRRQSNPLFIIKEKEICTNYDTTITINATDTIKDTANKTNNTSKEEMINTIKNYFKNGNLAVDALKVINGERQDYYGNPEDSFNDIANVWKWYLKSIYSTNICITSKDVATMMALFKIARNCNQNKEDNIIDAIGYLALAGDMKD